MNPTLNTIQQKNPPVELAYPHICIGEQIIICQLQHQLRDAATAKEYLTYLQNKFQWPANSHHHIHWKVSQLTLQCLTHAERRVISKFIHEWLPLLDRHHVQSNSVNNYCHHAEGLWKQSVTSSTVHIQNINKYGTICMKQYTKCISNRMLYRNITIHLSTDCTLDVVPNPHNTWWLNRKTCNKYYKSKQHWAGTNSIMGG